MMRKILFAAVLLAGACRGQPSDKQPLHLVPDMDWQPKFKAEMAAPHAQDDEPMPRAVKPWDDHRAMRPAIDGTIPMVAATNPTLDHDAFALHEDEGYNTGAVTSQQGGSPRFLNKVPMAVDADALRRGQDRFNIYCTPCHDRTGGGHGMVVQRGYPPPVQLFSDRVRNMPDGQVFWTMTNGVRNMPAYRKQIPVEDRWKIVAWVRVIGRSQHASVNDVPSESREKIDPETK